MFRYRNTVSVEIPFLTKNMNLGQIGNMDIVPECLVKASITVKKKSKVWFSLDIPGYSWLLYDIIRLFFGYYWILLKIVGIL